MYGLSVSISISLSSCHWAYSVCNLNERHDNWFVYYSPCLPLWYQRRNVLWILELLIHFYFEEISSSNSLIIWASFLYHCLLDISYCMFYRYFKQSIYKSELIETSRCPHFITYHTTTWGRNLESSLNSLYALSPHPLELPFKESHISPWPPLISVSTLN